MNVTEDQETAANLRRGLEIAKLAWERLHEAGYDIEIQLLKGVKDFPLSVCSVSKTEKVEL